MDRGHNEGEIHQNGHFSFQFLSGGCWPKTAEAEETKLGKLIIGISGHSLKFQNKKAGVQKI